MVTEEQLNAEKRRQKEAEVARLEATKKECEEYYAREVTLMTQRIDELKKDLAALPGGER